MSIRIINGQITIERRVLFSRLNLTIERGRMYRLHGKNGVGKTVLIHTLLGIHALQSGRWENRFKKTDIVYIPDSPFFFDDESMKQVLKLFKRFYNICPKQELSVMEEMQLSIQELSKIKISDLSLGMRKKLMLVPLFLDDAQLFVLDEIFVGLADGTQQLILQRLAKLHQMNKTVVIIEHNEYLMDQLKQQIRVEELLCRDGSVI